MQVAFLQKAVPNEPQQHPLVAPVPGTTESRREVSISGPWGPRGSREHRGRMVFPSEGGLMSNVGEAPWEAPGHPAHPNRRKSKVPATARDGGGREWVRRGDEGEGVWARKQTLCSIVHIWMIQREPASLKKIQFSKTRHKPTVLAPCSSAMYLSHHSFERWTTETLFPLLGRDVLGTHTLHLPDTHIEWALKSTLVLWLFCGPARLKQRQKDRQEGYALRRVHKPHVTHNSLLKSAALPCKLVQKAGHSCCKVNTFSLLSVSVTLLLIWATWSQCIHNILACTIYSFSIWLITAFIPIRWKKILFAKILLGGLHLS